MENIEVNHSHWLDSHISPENTKWVAENLKGFDQAVNKISKLIECDGSSYAQLDDYEHKRPELLSHVEEFSRLHQLLAEKYNHLIGEVQRNFPSLPETQNLDSYDPGSPKASIMLSPEFLNAGGGSSNISLREGSDSSSSLSSDSDIESLNSINKRLVSPLRNDNILKLTENGSYEVLFRRVNDYEEQLLVLNKKLKFSEEQIASLKEELKKNEPVTLLDPILQAQLDSVQSFEIQNSNFEVERGKTLKLHNQVVELETQICNAESKIRSLSDELEVSREKLLRSEDEITSLKYKLSSEISIGTHELQLQLERTKRDMTFLENQLNFEKDNVLEMQEKILRYAADLTVRDNQITDLNTALCDVKDKHCIEKEQLHSEISSLFEKQALLKARVDSLEYETKQQKDENVMIKNSHEAEVERLKAELLQNGVAVESLNKELDHLKLKYDTLMAEKDGLKAQVETLNAELSSREDITHQMKIELSNLASENMRLTNESDWEKEAMRVRAEELEKEVERQRDVISERAEEKREAIKQLCFSLEYYRSGYKELCQAYVGLK